MQPETNAFCGTRYIKVHRDKSLTPVCDKIAHPLDRFSKLKHSIARRVPVPNRAAVERFYQDLSDEVLLCFGITLVAE